MRDIGKNIRAARDRSGLRQEDLAERLHVSRQTVSNYETGRSRPDIDMLLAIAAATDVDVTELLYGPAVLPDRRRDLRRLWVVSLLAVGFLLIELALRKISPYDAGYPFRLAFRLLPVPVAFTALGWSALQACGLFLRASPLQRPWGLWGRRLLLVGGLCFLAVILPLVIWQIQNGLELVALHQQGGEFSFSSSYNHGPLWNRITQLTTEHLALRPVRLVPYGGLLWVFGFPAGRKNHPGQNSSCCKSA